MLAHSLAASGYVDKEWMHWRLVFFFLALQWTEVCPPSRQLSRPQLMIQGPNLSALSMCAPPVRRHSGGCQLGSPEEPGGGGAMRGGARLMTHSRYLTVDGNYGRSGVPVRHRCSHDCAAAGRLP